MWDLEYIDDLESASPRPDNAILKGNPRVVSFPHFKQVLRDARVVQVRPDEVRAAIARVIRVKTIEDAAEAREFLNICEEIFKNFENWKLLDLDLDSDIWRNRIFLDKKSGFSRMKIQEKFRPRKIQR